MIKVKAVQNGRYGNLMVRCTQVLERGTIDFLRLGMYNDRDTMLDAVVIVEQEQCHSLPTKDPLS